MSDTNGTAAALPGFGGYCANCHEMEERLREEVDLRHLAEQEKLRVVRAYNKLKTDISKAKADDPLSETVKEILRFWVSTLGKNPKIVKVPIDGVRADTVRDALKHSTADELKRAIRGLALKPYVGDSGRTGDADGARRFDDLKYAIGDEVRVETFGALVPEEVASAPEQREGDEQLGFDQAPFDLVRSRLTDGLGLRVTDPLHGHFMAQCPAHDDTKFELSIREQDDRSVLVHCRVGCSTQAILNKLDLSLAAIAAPTT